LTGRVIVPVGARAEVEVDVRLAAACERDPACLDGARGGPDQYYSVMAYPVYVPPLRARPGDVPELAYHFLDKHRAEAGRSDVIRIEDGALRLLARCPWPGNVRQLEDCIRNALLAVGSGNVLTGSALPDDVHGRTPAPTAAPRRDGERPAPPTVPSPFHDPETGNLLPLREIEDRAFRMALEEHGGNTTRAAKALGVARATFYRRLKSKRAG
jgi:transcriptional regulator with PAS, ATPase and Fis domain